MKPVSHLQSVVLDYVDRRRDRLIEIAQELVRIPSENTPPTGAEQNCQAWMARQFEQMGLHPDLYAIDEVAGLTDHLLFFPGREYRDRPNLAVRRPGSGGGRSLLLTGHIDTVPRGTQDWSRDPFSGHVEGNFLYGRGSNDMKAGIATNLFVVECVQALDLPLAGDLLFESVVDEEFGGANGTLAGRLRGHNADAAILSEPSSLRICPAQRGGQVVDIRFRNSSGGVLHSGRFPTGVIPQLTHFLASLKDFAFQRSSRVRPHDMYASLTDPVPVSITKVVTSPWGFHEPITVPDAAQVQLYWQFMPGEMQSDIDHEFEVWLRNLVRGAPDVYPRFPEVSRPVRWLPGSAISASEPLVMELSASAEKVLGRKPRIEGIEGPCDLFVFHQGFDLPAVIFGARGGNAHAADEYVEIDSLIAAAKTLLFFVAEWCGSNVKPS
jgi:acetylornithine deacetylase